MATGGVLHLLSHFGSPTAKAGVADDDGDPGRGVLPLLSWGCTLRTGLRVASQLNPS